MITVQRVITADDTDMLANTDLANIPGDGQLDIWLASTQNDTQFSITGPGNEPVARLQRVAQRTNGIPVLKDDPPYSLPVSQGGHYVVNVDIVTAATVMLIAIWRSVAEFV